MRRFLHWLLDPRCATLWHPDSPGMRVRVRRTRFGRWLKPSCFATLGECLRDGVGWRAC